MRRRLAFPLVSNMTADVVRSGVSSAPTLEADPAAGGAASSRPRQGTSAFRVPRFGCVSPAWGTPGTAQSHHRAPASAQERSPRRWCGTERERVRDSADRAGQCGAMRDRAGQSGALRDSADRAGQCRWCGAGRGSAPPGAAQGTAKKEPSVARRGGQSRRRATERGAPLATCKAL